jgi:hypothetical protein
MMMENLVEWRLAGETEVLGESLPQRHFVHHKSHMAAFVTSLAVLCLIISETYCLTK